jgi:plasmid stability protein
MADMIIRNLSDAVHRALTMRAAQHNRSVEAEALAILEAAALPEGRLRLGTALAEMSRKHGVTNADVEALERAIEAERDRRPAEPMRFE